MSLHITQIQTFISDIKPGFRRNILGFMIKRYRRTYFLNNYRELFHRQGENIHKFLLAHTSEAHTGRGLQTGIHPGQHKLQRVPFAGKTAFLQNGGRKKGTKKRPPNGLRQRQATLRLPVLYVLLEHNQQLLY